MSRWKLRARPCHLYPSCDLISMPAESHLALKLERREQWLCCPGQEESRTSTDFQTTGKHSYKLHYVDAQYCSILYLRCILFIFSHLDNFSEHFLVNDKIRHQASNPQFFKPSITSLYLRQSSPFMFLQKVWRAGLVLNILVVPEQIKVQQQPLGLRASENLLCCSLLGVEDQDFSTRSPWEEKQNPSTCPNVFQVIKG